MKFCKERGSWIVFYAKYASNIRDQARHFVLVEVFYEALPKKFRSRPTVNSSWYVLGVHKFALRNMERSRRYGNSAVSQTHKKAIDFLGSATKQNYGTIVELHLEDEQCQMRMHEQGHTESDMEHLTE